MHCPGIVCIKSARLGSRAASACSIIPNVVIVVDRQHHLVEDFAQPVPLALSVGIVGARLCCPAAVGSSHII